MRSPILGLLVMSSLAAPPSDDLDLVLDALVRGTRAEQHGDTRGMRAAGASLSAADAREIDGPNLARKWTGDRTVSAGYRNRALGPAYRSLALTPGATVRFEQTFLAGQQAQVAVVPIDRGRFGLSVTDDEGTVSCATASVGRCAWIPPWTTRYRIAVTNQTNRPARYYLVVR